jgi:ABC-type ATPase involved in cell division
MTLLALESVSKRYRCGSREHVALRGVSLAFDPGELVVVLGTRKSGRSTLLRVAAGLERPDEGRVCLEGVPLTRARDVVGRRICYCHTGFSPMEGDRLVDHVATALLARGVPSARARRAAETALERAGVLHCAGMDPDELGGAERVRAAIARGLVGEPRVIVIDDPTAGVGLLQSEGVLRLLRSIADASTTVLMSTDDATCIAGADHAFALDDGTLRADVQAPRADVVPLRPRALAAESGAHLV